MALQNNVRIAMLQPNYIPWKGVFDLISRVDIFVFYDDVQYTSKDWRSRNKIASPQGELWLTVPVKHDGRQLICNSLIDRNTSWQKKHYKSIYLNYKKAPYFEEYHYLLEEIYLKHCWENLCELNVFSTQLISKALDLNPQWVRSSQLGFTGNKDGEKVVKICKALGANYFINGPASKAFMNEDLFREAGIHLEYMQYSYSEYLQLHKPFRHDLSILDVLFNCGKASRKMIQQLNRGQTTGVVTNGMVETGKNI